MAEGRDPTRGAGGPDGEGGRPGGDDAARAGATARVVLAEMRARYVDTPLLESDVDPDPVAQLQRWLDDAVRAGLTEPNAMVVATVGPAGPDARTVLLKGLDASGLRFFTNLGSAKARQLAADPRVAAVFPWHAMSRQVRVTGTVRRLPEQEVAAYFASRPREARLGAWASRQSSVVASRDELDSAYAAIVERFPDGTDVPLPEFWGGFLIAPETVELWAGRSGRLHDRLRYRRAGPGWRLERLAP